jgi:hypothetical protein
VAVELGVVAEVELEHAFALGEAVGELALVVDGGYRAAEFAFVEGDGNFNLVGFGDPETLLPSLDVDGFAE